MAISPENFLAVVFLEAYQTEWDQRGALLEFLESEEGRLYTSTFAPQIGAHFEQQTLEEQAWWQQASATAVGVAAAIEFALQAQPQPPETGGTS